MLLVVTLFVCTAPCTLPIMTTTCLPLQVFLTHDYLAIAMEYAAGGDMFQHVKQKRGLQEYEVSAPEITAYHASTNQDMC